MQITDVAAVFPVIFLGELPDKTMFASLALASRGRPLAVWVGASVAFVVHVAIAVTVGGLLVAVVPHRALQLAVAAGFLAGAGWSWHSRGGDDHRQQVPAPPPSWPRVAAVAGATIFVAEWGDLTQVLTVQLAARYDPLSVAVGAAAALVAVAGLAVATSTSLLRVLSVRLLRSVTAVVLLGLGVTTLVDALG